MTGLLQKLREHYDYLVEQIEYLETQLQISLDEDSAGQRLLSIPCVGPLTASMLSTQLGDGKQYGSSEDFAASTGLVPREYSTGGRTTLMGFSPLNSKTGIFHHEHATKRNTEAQKIDSVQSLRAFAALSVMFFHYRLIIGPSVVGDFFNWGSIGVDLFFVISGYIMAYTTLQTPPNAYSAIKFIRNRFIRIMPVYYILLLVAFLLGMGLCNLSYPNATMGPCAFQIMYCNITTENRVLIFSTSENCSVSLTSRAR